MRETTIFNHLEIDLFEVRCLQTIEMIAEKVRATFQRAKVRDLYDLYCFAKTPFDGGLLRRLVVLKLWQARDPFDPQAFLEGLKSSSYDWDDLHRLVRSSEAVEPGQIVRTVETRFAALQHLTELEQQLIADAKSGWNEPLADQLRVEIHDLVSR
jgi:predicted nucleotidyltransferase component of viral defense system